LHDFVHACSVQAKVSQNFLNAVPKKETYLLPDDHRVRAYNPILTNRDIQRLMSLKLPEDDSDHLEMLELNHHMIYEFENVSSIKQASFLPGGDFVTHHNVFDKLSLFYLLRDSNVPGIPYSSTSSPSYENMLRMILTR